MWAPSSCRLLRANDVPAHPQATSPRAEVVVLRDRALLETGNDHSRSSGGAAIAGMGASAVATAACTGRRWLKKRRRTTRRFFGDVAVQEKPHVASDQPARVAPGPHDVLLRMAKGEVQQRSPVWLMRQAGRYMQAFRDYSDYIPFRKRSETPSMAVELSLQCWRRFGMDGVIMFSDILTPLPALGIPFDVIRGKGPVVHFDLDHAVQTYGSYNGDDETFDAPALDSPEGKAISYLRLLHHPLSTEDFEVTHGFVRETLQRLRREVEGKSTLLGFIGAPWTLLAYSVEGGSTRHGMRMKQRMYRDPEIMEGLLMAFARHLANYAVFQAQSGAQCVQVFDSWAHLLTPAEWRRFAAPYVRHVAEAVRKRCPGVPVIYFANGGSSYLREQVEALSDCIDVLAVDQFVGIGEAVKIAEGSGLILQGNVDPLLLRFGKEQDIRDAVRRNIDEAGGPGRHILNLGHGVVQQTPEENVLYFVDEAQKYQN